VVCRQRASGQLDLPEQLDLPYFAYGLFKPGELAFGQIKSLVEEDPVEAQVPGALYVRDGLPLLEPKRGNSVHGSLLRFLEGSAEDAYATISAFEPRKHYRWKRVTLDTGEMANTLVGLSPDRGSIHNEEGMWTGRQDPVFVMGLSVVREVVDQQAREEFHSAHCRRGRRKRASGRMDCQGLLEVSRVYGGSEGTDRAGASRDSDERLLIHGARRLFRRAASGDLGAAPFLGTVTEDG